MRSTPDDVTDRGPRLGTVLAVGAPTGEHEQRGVVTVGTWCPRQVEARGRPVAPVRRSSTHSTAAGRFSRGLSGGPPVTWRRRSRTTSRHDVGRAGTGACRPPGNCRCPVLDSRTDEPRHTYPSQEAFSPGPGDAPGGRAPAAPARRPLAGLPGVLRPARGE